MAMTRREIIIDADNPYGNSNDITVPSIHLAEFCAEIILSEGSVFKHVNDKKTPEKGLSHGKMSFSAQIMWRIPNTVICKEHLIQTKTINLKAGLNM